jgi:hypothetical protein
VLLAVAPAGAATLKLPTPAEAAALPRAFEILGVKPGEFPNKSPGPITGAEIVRVGVGPDGSAGSIVVDQTLVINGTGDFTIEVPGPAVEVETPAGSTARPGLRRGSVIWEGFSPGRRELRATVTLDTAAPSFRRLPVTVSVISDANGTALRIRNDTAAPRAVRVGDADRAQLGAVLDDISRRLRDDERLVFRPSIDATGAVSTTTIPIVVPMRVRGELVVDGARTTVDTVVLDEPFERRVARGASVDFTLSAEPALPPASVVRAPSGSWRAALAGAPAGGARDALLLAERTLWQILRIPDAEYFLGNPLGGRSSARYEFRPFVPESAPPPAADDERVPKPIPIAVAMLGVMAIFSGAVAVWRRL